MHIEELQQYCLSKPHTSNDFPFDEKTLVFRVANKIFAITSIVPDSETVNLKCNPERAEELREEHPELIIPGYHMSKKHWNTVNYVYLPKPLLIELIDHSYDLITASFSKKMQKELGFIHD